jgi:hypothetical protein
MNNNLYEDSDFIELVIKHIIRDVNIHELARQYKLTADDVGGIEIYRGFVTVALALVDVPPSINLFLLKIKEAYNTGVLNKLQEGQILEFLYWVYNEQPLDSSYIQEHLPKMLKHRRMGALFQKKDIDFDNLASGINELAFEFDGARTSSNEDAVFHPFLKPVFKTLKESFSTGFLEIDAIAQGLSLGEYGVILGYSGTGKTAVATYSALQNALNGVKVLYISLEEASHDIANRFYSNYFSINYSDLHHVKNGATAELQSKMNCVTPEELEILKNIRIAPLKDQAPVTFSTLRNYLENLYRTEGYTPDVIYIDQLDYISPATETKEMWQKYEKLTFEADNFSNYKINGEHRFALWVLHQASGKMRRIFSNSEISGYKGLWKTPDIVIGIGKDNPTDEIVTIFSLKTRHSKGFTLDYFADLAYMRFATVTKGGEARKEKQTELLGKGRKRSFFNNVPRQQKLPSPDGAFD